MGFPGVQVYLFKPVRADYVRALNLVNEFRTAGINGVD